MSVLPDTSPQVRSRLPVVAAVLLIFFVAAVLRFAWLDRVPLGWHHDEALMGVMAGEVYRGESRPIFFPQYLGQEPLYIYLAAGMMALRGGDPGYLPLRLTSAVVGLLTVIVSFGLGRALFGTRVGLLALAVSGVSFWQVMSGRMAYRSITQPLLEGVAVWLLWQARRRGGLRWYAATGVALGGVLYTYLGARAFPAVFLGYGLWLLLTRGRPKQEEIRRVAVLTLVAVIVVAPLGVYFLTHPGTFSARMEQVYVFRPEVNGGHPWRLVAESAAKMLRGFTISGEPMWRYNIPGRPIFVGALALAFYGGLIVLLRRLWHRDDAAALVIIWLAAMLFPGLLSWESGAYTLRAMGLVPAVFFVPALGLDWVWRQVGRRARWGPALATAALAIVLLIETGWTARDYFLVWAPSFGAEAEGHADAVAQARFLSQAARPDQEDVFVASEYYHHPVLAQLAGPVYSALRWFDGRQSVAFSPDSGRPALYVLAFNGLPPEVDRLFPRDALVGSQPFAEGLDGGDPPPLFLAYRLTSRQIRSRVDQILADPNLRPIGGRIPGVLEPLRAGLDSPVRPGGELRVTVVWRVVGPPPPGEYRLLAHLLDYRLQKVGGSDALGYPVQEWRAGDLVWSRFVIPVPTDAPAGRYQVQLALFNLGTGERLPVEGGILDSRAFGLGDVRVMAAEPPNLPSRPIGARWEPGIELVGVDEPARPAPATLAVTLHWRAETTPREDYTVFVQLLDAGGRLVAQSDSWPAGGRLPTSAWLPGELVRDEHRLTLKPDLPPGNYRLVAGLYLLATGQRLTLAGGGDSVELATLTLP